MEIMKIFKRKTKVGKVGKYGFLSKDELQKTDLKICKHISIFQDVYTLNNRIICSPTLMIFQYIYAVYSI